MIAKHLFIFKDGFNPDDQVVNGAKALETKYSPKAYSRSTIWINGSETTPDQSTESTANASSFRFRNGVSKLFSC